MSDYDESFEDFDDHVAEASHAPSSIIYEDVSFEAESDSPPVFAVGDQVDVYWAAEEAWFHGIVRASKPPQYFIAYDDGDEQWEVRQCTHVLECITRKIQIGRCVTSACQSSNEHGKDYYTAS
ncbi:hypothetical protein ACHHYP_10154 [Achlya hypogyna]|uniref:Tudor domain-containing protein n=1 Tax=Achlya hypogyna TaxID=1202772 RepID=A0A1V9ZHW7_ACHHY|nr:hypothetical protein ACHHYP_10154 [Achlya hypogyna]